MNHSVWGWCDACNTEMYEPFAYWPTTSHNVCVSCWANGEYRNSHPKQEPSASSTATVRPRLTYICHAYSGYGTIEGNKAAVRLIARSIAEFGDTPLAPQLMLPEMYDEATERDKAMEVCLRLIDSCDVVEVRGVALTAGMIKEIAHAIKIGKPVVDLMNGLRLLLPKS